MKKEEFLKQLEQSLVSLSPEDRKDIIGDYEEHFKSGEEKGRSEEELSKSLGNPNEIARQIKADYTVRHAADTASASNILRAVFATAGLGFFNLVFIIGPFFGLVGVLVGLFGAGIGIFAGSVVAGLASIFAAINPQFLADYVNYGINPTGGLFLSISAVSFSLLWFIGCGYLTKWFYQLTVWYLKLNLSIIQGKKD